MKRECYSQSRRDALQRKLAAYSSVAGAAVLAAAGTADAQAPIYVDYEPDSLMNAFTDLDLNQDGSNDVRIYPGGPPGALGKGAALSWTMGIGFLSNAGMTSAVMWGPGSSCSYGYGEAIMQSVCSSQGVIPECPLTSPTKALSKVFTAGIFIVPDAPGDYFLKLAGMGELAPPSASAKVAAPGPWTGWLRFGVTNEGLTPPIYLKDHLLLPDGSETPFSCNPGDFPLPVELISFGVHQTPNGLELRWETGSEENNAGFQVQYRAADEDAFSSLAFVPGAGSTDVGTSYRYTVEDELEPGGYVFRLKQIDFDGSFEYSQEVEASIDVPGTHYLGDAYPNPFNPQATFSVVVSETQSVRVELFDASGRSVSVLYEGTMAADTPERLVIDGSGLSSGTYLYRATGETFVETKQLSLNK